MSIEIIEYFTTQETSSTLFSDCIIVPKDMDTFPLKIGRGSYNIAPARVLGLDYPTYLRFLRDSFPNAVTIVGKGSRYSHPIWKPHTPELRTFLRYLNTKLTIAMKAYEEAAASEVVNNE
jgi:hypothetical protein